MAAAQNCRRVAMDQFKQDMDNLNLPNFNVANGVSLKQEIRMFLLGDRGDMPDVPQTEKTMKSMIAAEIFDIRDENGGNMQDEDNLDNLLRQRIEIGDNVWAQLANDYNDFRNKFDACDNQAGGKRKKTRKQKKHHKKTRKQKKQRKSKKSY